MLYYWRMICIIKINKIVCMETDGSIKIYCLEINTWMSMSALVLVIKSHLLFSNCVLIISILHI